MLKIPHFARRLRRRSVLVAGWIGLAFVSIAIPARADRRVFTWTYEAQTLPRGEAELEGYTTFSAPDRAHTRNATATRLQIELESGMTDRMDFSVYQVFDQAPGAPMVYDGYKLRFRHRLSSPEAHPFATVAYLEYKGRPDFSTDGVEAKAIFGRDAGPFRLALNAIVEVEPENGSWEVEPQYAAGAAWLAGELLSLGVEARGGEEGHLVGPVVGHGLGDLWMAFGSGLLLGRGDGREAELETRLILGVGVR